MNSSACSSRSLTVPRSFHHRSWSRSGIGSRRRGSYSKCGWSAQIYVSVAARVSKSKWGKEADEQDCNGGRAGVDRCAASVFTGFDRRGAPRPQTAQGTNPAGGGAITGALAGFAGRGAARAQTAQGTNPAGGVATAGALAGFTGRGAARSEAAQGADTSGAVRTSTWAAG